MADNGVPMFGPDGAVHMVQSSDVQAAQQSGGELAHQLKAPDGSLRYVRHSDLGEALKAGGVPISAAQSAPQAPQQLTNLPDQPGLQAAPRGFLQRMQDVAQSAYDSSIPGIVNKGAGALSQVLAAKANQRDNANQVAAAQGQPQPNGGSGLLRAGADAAGLVSGASSPTGLAVAGTAMVPVAGPAAIAGYGGFKAFQNKQALVDLLTSGKANPEQTQQALTGLAMLAGGAAGVKGNVDALPSKANASANFDAAMKQAGNSPVDVNAAGEQAFRIKQIADSGAQMPKVVRNFISRVTDPTKGPLTYAEARDFYSNATNRLSPEEFNKLTPVMRMQLGEFASRLGKSIQDTADASGVGAEHSAAMQEFRSASQLQRGVNEANGIAVKTAKAAIPAAGAAYAAKQIWDASH